MDITVQQLRDQFPSPVHRYADGDYCTGGSLCLTLDPINGEPFPTEQALKQALMEANSRLDEATAYALACEIIDDNDAECYEAAWERLGEGLTRRTTLGEDRLEDERRAQEELEFLEDEWREVQWRDAAEGEARAQEELEFLEDEWREVQWRDAAEGEARAQEELEFLEDEWREVQWRDAAEGEARAQSARDHEK